MYDDSTRRERRLFVEELCCHLCRLHHGNGDVGLGNVCIEREFYLGRPGAYADVRVTAPGAAPYFVEVCYGYPPQMLVHSLERKYAECGPETRIVLVAEVLAMSEWAAIEVVLRSKLSASIEVWDEAHLSDMVSGHLGPGLSLGDEAAMMRLADAINQSSGYYAFGGPSPEEYRNDPVQSALLWNFASWHLRELRLSRNMGLRDILRPNRYNHVVVLLADLSSFSSLVRDTRDEDLIRWMMTCYHTRARYAIINSGGMLVQFVGDEAFALFGIPDSQPGFVGDALTTARRLVDIGGSISHSWQRQIDRVQEPGGVHIGMAIGDLQIFSQRPFSRAHMGTVGDPINVAARLMNEAGPGQIVVSNALYQHLDPEDQATFTAMDPVEAKNVGRIRSWRMPAIR